MNTPLLGCDGLACGHGRTVLSGVDLRVAAGESWFVVGANGSGKSTLIATLLGLLPPRHGRVLPVAGGDRVALGYVPQEAPRSPTMPCTVFELVAMAVSIQGVGRQRRRERVRSALTQLGIGDLAARDVRRLSVGQRRRALVARALARQPRLLVLDEPTANLDAGAARRMVLDLDRLRREHGLTMVHVCHDLALAERHASHLAFVGSQAVVAGPFADVRSDARVAAWLMGDGA